MAMVRMLCAKQHNTKYNTVVETKLSIHSGMRLWFSGLCIGKTLHCVVYISTTGGKGVGKNEVKKEVVWKKSV